MNTPELLNELYRLDIRVASEGNNLVYDAPHGTLTLELRAQLRAHKTALLQRLHESAGEVVPVAGVNIAHDLPISELVHAVKRGFDGELAA